MKIATYDTDLTPDQWHLLRRFLPAAKKRGRPRTALRAVINAILYLVKTGAQWRLLPKNFPPWQTVDHHFRQWTRNGLLARLNHRLRAKVRQAVGKHAQSLVGEADPKGRRRVLRVNFKPHGLVCLRSRPGILFSFHHPMPAKQCSPFHAESFRIRFAGTDSSQFNSVSKRHYY